MISVRMIVQTAVRTAVAFIVRAALRSIGK
jgi:hypothetical protein